MGFRFRKSKSFGPFRINLSKKGIGWSVGGKGFRFTKKAGGGTRKTMSVPGTGISYVTDCKKATAPSKATTNNTKVTPKTPNVQNTPPKASGEKSNFFKNFTDYINDNKWTKIVAIICIIIFSCCCCCCFPLGFFMDKEALVADENDVSSSYVESLENNEEASEPVTTPTTTTSTTTTPTTTTELTTTPTTTTSETTTTAKPTTTTKTTVSTAKPTTKATAKPATTVKTTAKTTAKPQVGTVFWVASGEKYHKSKDCPTLKRSKTIFSGSLSEAKSKGKTELCKVCG